VFGTRADRRSSPGRCRGTFCAAWLCGSGAFSNDRFAQPTIRFGALKRNGSLERRLKFTDYFNNISRSPALNLGLPRDGRSRRGIAGCWRSANTSATPTGVTPTTKTCYEPSGRRKPLATCKSLWLLRPAEPRCGRLATRRLPRAGVVNPRVSSLRFSSGSLHGVGTRRCIPALPSDAGRGVAETGAEQVVEVRKVVEASLHRYIDDATTIGLAEQRKCLL